MRLLVVLHVMLLAAVSAAAPRDAGGGIDVVILGDSNTSIGGDSCNVELGWSKWFCDRFEPRSCVSYARSGATWTNTPRTVADTKETTAKLSDNNVIYNQVMRLAADHASGSRRAPGLIMIMAGTNDAWFVRARPRALEQDVAGAFAADRAAMAGRRPAEVLTMAAAVRHCCIILNRLFPDAQIILISPMQSVAAGFDNIRKAGDIIEECGRRLSVGVIRLDREGGIEAEREAAARHFTSDGTHTNRKGAQRIGRFIASRVGTMLQL